MDISLNDQFSTLYFSIPCLIALYTSLSAPAPYPMNSSSSISTHSSCSKRVRLWGLILFFFRFAVGGGAYVGLRTKLTDGDS